MSNPNTHQDHIINKLTQAVAHGTRLSLKPIRNQIFMSQIYRKHISVQTKRDVNIGVQTTILFISKKMKGFHILDIFI